MTSTTPTNAPPVIVLFRHDLRCADNGALAAAADTGRPVVCAFVLDEESQGIRPLGGASRWWLHHSLSSLGKRLTALGCPLILRKGRMDRVVADLVADSGADTVFWNRRYNPPEVAVDAALKQSLREQGLHAESFDGQLLHEPLRLKTGSGGPYKVYTAFWRALMQGPPPRDPVDPPKALEAHSGTIASRTLADLVPLPTKPDWAKAFPQRWTPGEDGAHQRLGDFLDGALEGYAANRDRPAVDGTSGLSPHLAFGEITPFQIFALISRQEGSEDIERFRKEVVWREFSYHLLFHNPDLATRNFQSGFDAFAWQHDDAALSAWQTGMTGYPIVDAGMRQLWQTGWMHNRIRMVVASFLSKHLLIDWRAGEDWFWDTLVDADPANNPASWQWVAGSGADAAPYFRIFNPVLQGEKFDSAGDYVRLYVPELAGLPDRYIHKPWEAPEAVLRDAGVTLGKTYPRPVVDHTFARKRALAAYGSL